MFKFHDDPLRYWPQITAAGGIVVGGIVGWGAALETGDLFRFAGTLLFLAITVALYVWKFHLAKKQQ
jgi:preprotein translocase subunit SecY